MKRLLLLIVLTTYFIGSAQDQTNYEKPPVFSECASQPFENLRICFNNSLSKYIYQNFKVPSIVNDENYKGDVMVLFEVNAEGQFVVNYVDAVFDELKTATKLVFAELPKIEPATYNGRAVFKQYSYTIAIPLVDPGEPNYNKAESSKVNEISKLEQQSKTEYDSVSKSLRPYSNSAYRSQLNIPFTHQMYSRFDRQINLVGTNSHSASKPYMYESISKYYDFEQANDALKKEGDGWWTRKLFNEHLVQVESKDYWFTIDPIFDFQVGKDTDADFNSTFNNTRGLYIQGGLGKRLSFSASVFESQGRFAQYFNEYAETIRAAGSDVSIIPGRGIGKRFKDDAYDYPVAEAYLSYSPVDFLNVQFGHGKNFIGDGYRSLFQSDVASPSPFFKINTTFWKIKYTNTWMWLKDVRPEVTEDGDFLTKYMANHYLSWNVSKRLNLGFFESVIWSKSDNRGFDVNFLNPIIFYRAIEFETGAEAGNAIVGASAKYKVNDNVNVYSQFILDEFSINDIKGGKKSWKNKFGYQIGAKYYNAFKVNNLMLQLEYNRVRPYTYSHNTIRLNYAHNNQSMAHLWGANFSEVIVIGHYNYKRWFADAKFVFGKRGLDFNSANDTFAYGGDIFTTENDRPSNNGITVGQGNATNIFHAELQSGYVVNPKTNLKLFAYLSYRNFNPEAETDITFKNSTLWFSVGLRTDLFNWYFDF